MFENNFWLTLALRILMGSGAIFAVALALRKLAKGVAAERAIWQAALVAISCLAIWEAARFEIKLPASFYLVGERPQITVTTAEVASPKREIGTASSAMLPEASNVRAAAQPNHGLPWAGLFWAGGIAALIGYSLFQTWVCFWIKRKSRLVTDNGLEKMLSELKADSQISFGVSLHESRFFQTPVAFGLVKKSVGVPLKFKNDFSPDEQKVLLCHELMHLVNRDPLWRLCSDLLCAISWWNPFAWLARRKFLHACEMTADEGAVLLTGNQTALAETLVTFAQRLKPRVAGNWSGMAGEAGRSTLALRIKRLLNTPMKGGWRKTRWGFFKSIVCMPALLGISLIVLLLVGKGTPALAFKSDTPSAFDRIMQGFPDSATPVTDESANSKAAVFAPNPPELPSKGIKNEAELVRSNEEPRSEGIAVASIDPQTAPNNTPSSPEPAAPTRIQGSEKSTASAELAAAYEELQKTLLQYTEKHPMVLAQKSLISRLEKQSALEGQHADVSTAAAQVVPKPQLLFSVKIIEVTGGDLNSVGLEHLLPNFKRGGVTTNASTAADEIKTVRMGVRETNAVSGANLQPMNYKLPMSEMKELLKELEAKAGVEVVSAPRVITLAGQEALITIGNTFPIVTGFKTNTAAAGISTKKKGQVEYVVEQIEMGTKVWINGTMPSENEVGLAVTARILEFAGYDQTVEPASEKKVPLPKFRSREVRVKSLVREGEGLLLTGLITPDERINKQKVPGLGDIPLLGRMFRNESRQTVMKHLLIVIEPTIVDDTGK